MAGNGIVDRYRSWPRWARIGAPVVAGLFVVGGIGSACGGDDGADVGASASGSGPEFDEVTTTTAALDEAIADASTKAGGAVTDAALGDLIVLACERLEGDRSQEAAEEVAESVNRAVSAPADMADVVSAIGTGAETYCPEEVGKAPNFLNQVVRAAPTTTSTTAVPTTVPTTAAPTTAPPPPPTTQPPPPPPPTTAAPAPGVYYENCAAARAAGAAPVRRGDPGYAAHLDRDRDGVGCE